MLATIAVILLKGRQSKMNVREKPMTEVHEGANWFLPLKWENSVVLFLARFVNNVLSALSLITWLRIFFRESWKPWFVEVWVLLLVLVLCICLGVGSPKNNL